MGAVVSITPDGIDITARGAKSRFIREQPADLTIEEIIERARAVGLKVFEHDIYNVRARDRKKAGHVKGGGGKRKRLTAAQTPVAPALNNKSMPDEYETQLRLLRQCILRVGLDGARRVMSEFESIHERIK